VKVNRFVLTMMLVASQPVLSGTLLAREFTLTDHGKLEIAIPESWQSDVRQPPNGLPPTLHFVPGSGQPFEILVTPLWPMNGRALKSDAASIRTGVEQSATEAQSQAVEKHIEVKELKSNSGTGFYFAATDRAPPPGEYKHLVQGVLPISDLLLSFTILTNDGQGAVVEQALTALKQAVHQN
jgi:hypothetical protein